MTARGRAAACAKGRRKDGMLVNVKRNIPFSPPDISQAEIDEVADALRSGWITTGPKTKQIERDLKSLQVMVEVVGRLVAGAMAGINSHISLGANSNANLSESHSYNHET